MRFLKFKLFSCFQHNANVKSIDQDGRTPLAYARAALSIAIAKNQTNNTPITESNVSASRSLIELLISYGCPELSTFVPGSGTLPRRRGSQAIQHLEKLPSSIL